MIADITDICTIHFQYRFPCNSSKYYLRHLITKSCKLLHSHSCSASLDQTPARITPNIISILRTNQNFTSCYEQVFLSKLKTLLFTNPIPIHPLLLPVSPFQFQTPSTLAICLQP